MDNLCHTLVGAAIGETGLKRRTRFGNVTLMIAANLPDIDVLAFAADGPFVAVRRGWTHGVLAQAVLPMLLAGVMVLVARTRPARPSAAGDVELPPLSVRWLVALSFIGICSHVFLDYLNNYGVRLLSPIDWRWFYGDAVFIIDPWLWVMLGSGVWLTRRTQRPTPARGALVFAVCYVAVMLLSARAARDSVVNTWRATRGVEPPAVMVGPMPVTPLRRQVIVDTGDRYESGSFSWQSTAVTFGRTVLKNSDDPDVARARESPEIRGFLVWSRFPYWELEAVTDGTRVTVKDMRFGDRFAETVVVRPQNATK